MRFIPLADRGARALVLAVASNCKYFAAVERVPGLDYDQVGGGGWGRWEECGAGSWESRVSAVEAYRGEGLETGCLGTRCSSGALL